MNPTPIPFPVPGKAPMSDIVAAVVEHFGFDHATLQSHSRPEPLAWARMVAHYLCRELSIWTDVELGRCWNRSRSSIQQSHIAVKERMETCAKARAEVQALEERLRR